MSRRLTTLLLGACLVLVTSLGVVAPASASAGQVLALTNAARAGHGKAALSSAADLDRVAQAWAQTMAGDGNLRHNPSLSSQVSGWDGLAENVGYGPDVTAVHEALMDSSGHRANILGGHSEVGVGVASGGGAVWVVQVFRTPTPPPAPVPAPAPPVAAAAPAPAVAAPAPAPARAAAPVARAAAPAAPAAAPVAAPVQAPPLPAVLLPSPQTAATIATSSFLRRLTGDRGPARVYEPFIR